MRFSSGGVRVSRGGQIYLWSRTRWPEQQAADDQLWWDIWQQQSTGFPQYYNIWRRSAFLQAIWEYFRFQQTGHLWKSFKRHKNRNNHYNNSLNINIVTVEDVCRHAWWQVGGGVAVLFRVWSREPVSYSGRHQYTPLALRSLGKVQGTLAKTCTETVGTHISSHVHSLAWTSLTCIVLPWLLHPCLWLHDSVPAAGG